MLLLVIFPSSHFTEVTLKVANDVVFLLTLKQGLQSFFVFMRMHVIQACFLFMFMFLRDSLNNFDQLFPGDTKEVS